jgi:uncharacterized protein YggE
MLFISVLERVTIMMERLPISSWIINTLSLLLILFVALLSANQFKALKGEPKILNVTATGKARSAPDLATVFISVISEGQTALDVKNISSQKMNQVIGFIKQKGIDAKDIQTSGFQVSPKYDFSDNKKTILGYQANQTITVKVKNIDKSSEQLNQIVDGVITNGANQIDGVQFSLLNDDEVNQIARKQAIEKAILNAKQIAHDAGLRLGRVVNVITSNTNGSPPMPYQAALAGRANASANVEPGTQEVTETVTLVFQIR